MLYSILLPHLLASKECISLREQTFCTKFRLAQKVKYVLKDSFIPFYKANY